MKLSGIVVIVAVVVLSASRVCAAEKSAALSASPVALKSSSVNEIYPGLASSCLTHARLADLAKGTLLQAGELTIGEKDVTGQIAEAPEELREQLKKNAFFLLEQMATEKLLLLVAKAEAARTDKDLSKAGDGKIIEGYFEKLTNKTKVTDEETADFYKKNRDMFAGARLDQVKPQIGQYLLQEKKQEAVAEHLRILGKSVTIVVSASWVKAQAAPARDNPVDKARWSGKPSLVAFSDASCCGPDMVLPALDSLKQKHAERLNVVYIEARQEQVLTARYNARSIPTLIFYDKDGKEVLRHVGFFPQDEIEKELAKIGVK